MYRCCIYTLYLDVDFYIHSPEFYGTVGLNVLYKIILTCYSFIANFFLSCPATVRFAKIMPEFSLCLHLALNGGHVVY